MTSRSIILGVFAIILSACASQAPLDDAYYWPDKKAASLESSSSASQDKRPESSIDYLNIQDTTVTIRINR